MNKYILIFGALLISTTASAFNWSDLNPFSSDEKIEAETSTIPTEVELPTEDELKIKSAAASIEQFFKSNSIVDITDEQKQLLKQSYDYLKQQEITNPELKQVADNAIDLIDSSEIFLDEGSMIEGLTQ